MINKLEKEINLEKYIDLDIQFKEVQALMQKIISKLGKEIYLEKYIDLDIQFKEIQALMQKDKSKNTYIEQELIHTLQSTPLSDFDFIFMCTVLAELFPKPQYIELLLEATLYSDVLYPENKFYVWIQTRNTLFQKPNLCTEKISQLHKEVYNVLVNYLDSNIVIEKSTKDFRHPKRVVVMTQQILSENHAPTRSTLERSYILKKFMGMEVLIISTLENSSKNGIIPYYNAIYLNSIDAFNGMNIYPYKDENFKFYQPEYALNEPNGIQKLLSLVKEFNPYFIVYTGGSSYVADIINKFCPVITISTVFSSIPETNTSFTMVGRKIFAEEQMLSNSEIIEVPFTFEIVDKKRTHTRTEYNIPEDKFILAIVGSRLDADVTSEFIEYMSRLDNVFLVFIGKFETYTKRIIDNVWLSEHSVALGFVNDVVGILECTDLYVNPKRLGGGFSVIEGFHAGIPAVTINYGDVAVAAGNDFWVKDYNEMICIIDKYRTDKSFYKEKLQLAKKRESEITDGAKNFQQGIEKMLNSKNFF